MHLPADEVYLGEAKLLAVVPAVHAGHRLVVEPLQEGVRHPFERPHAVPTTDALVVNWGKGVSLGGGMEGKSRTTVSQDVQT